MNNIIDSILRHTGIKSTDPQRVAAIDAAADFNKNLDADARRHFVKRQVEGYDTNYANAYSEHYKYFATIGNSSLKEQKVLLGELVAKLDKLLLDYQNIAGAVNAKADEINSSDIVDEVKEATQFYQENSLNSLNKIIVELQVLNDKLKTKL